MRCARLAAALLGPLFLGFAAPGTSGTSPALAGDQDPAGPAVPADVYAARAPDVARAAAAKLWSAVEEARRSQLFEFARREAKRVLDLDPDHRGARTLLGFVKRDAAWVEDAALAAKTPAANFPVKPPPAAEQAAAEKRWVKDVAPKARAAAAAVWTALGDECAKKDDRAGAEKSHRRAIALDPDQERSRAALGFYRWQGAWVTEQQYRVVQANLRGKEADEDSPVDRSFAVKLNKVATEHFRFESRIPADRLLEIARWVETAYAVHLIELGRDPTQSVFPAPVRMVLCDTDRDWDAWIRDFVPKNRDFYRTLEGVWGESWQYGMKRPDGGDDDTRRDHLIHRAIHAIDSFTIGLFWPSWVDEGLAHLTTIRVQGMTKTWCLAPSKSEYAGVKRAGGSKAGWVDESEWKGAVRAAAEARDDLPLRTLVSQPFPQLGFAGVLKAWSVLDWWHATDPDGLRDALPKFRAAKDGTALIETHFGKGLEAVDEEWRRYVLANY